eukprot:CAMPEP_0118801646 /NCGR_PEP_ID=MMETSP1161-20130426/3122_1 /TAXON_ID=249345 /ORGANISM="Picochlorum oklahomensis, Strain CCMP2329" /LENGTH=105 /DNA_ID=CAMNT_0006729603 /DNA_START=12 /DNA_END=329 /DNA_ORIENTATION=+
MHVIHLLVTNNTQVINPVMSDVSRADTMFTPLLSKTDIPDILDTSGPDVPVILPVTLLYPVNWTVAPRIESIREPTSPAAAQTPTKGHWPMALPKTADGDSSPVR